MKQCHLGRDSLIWVQSSHSFKKINFKFIECWRVVLHWYALKARERSLEVRQLQSIRPIILVRRAKYLEDFEYLINLTIARE